MRREEESDSVITYFHYPIVDIVPNPDAGRYPHLPRMIHRIVERPGQVAAMIKIRQSAPSVREAGKAIVEDHDRTRLDKLRKSNPALKVVIDCAPVIDMYLSVRSTIPEPTTNTKITLATAYKRLAGEPDEVELWLNFSYASFGEFLRLHQEGLLELQPVYRASGSRCRSAFAE